MDPQGHSHLSRRRLLTTVTRLVALSAVPASVSAASPQLALGSADPAIMDKLSAYMGAAGDRALPAAIVEKTKQHVLDTLAAMVSGTRLPPGQVALRFAGLYSAAGDAPVVGASRTCSPLEAAVANGMLAHADETDNSHAPSHSHPGCAIVPAALVAGDLFGISGARFLSAVALGYDVGTRVLMSMGGIDYQLKTHHDAHSMANTFGASAAAACAASLTAQQTRWLLDFAAQQDFGITAWQRDRQHIEKAFVFAGAPARNGVTGALLIHAGATGVDDIFSGPDNFFPRLFGGSQSRAADRRSRQAL
ncbi:MAG: MmgE/PrpD family protein [Acidobacteriota bacterium]